jgi:hypothetical protein
LKALAKDPSERFQTAEEFQAALAGCPESSGALADARSPASTPRPAVSPPTRRDRFVDFFRRHKRAAMVVAGGLTLNVVVAGLIAVSLRSPAKPSPPPAPPPALAPATPVLASPSARHHLNLAEDYQRRLWCSDAIDELERTVREEPRLRANPELTRTAIPCLRAKTQERTIRFLVENVGSSARTELEAALAVESKPDVREGIVRALARFSGQP